MATINEDYVFFETAKLLKEKGFDGECDLFGRTDESEATLQEASKIAYNQGIDDECVIIPTLQMAMKWLREVHKIHIQIWILEEKGYWFDIEKILNAKYKHKSLYSTGLEDIYFEIYEQACEAAIKYCLENLI